MTRPSRDDVLMRTARVWEDMSTCNRNHVGCVIAMERRIIATGYNGAVAGMPHCDHTCTCSRFDEWHLEGCPAHPANGCPTTVHAEANAIVFAAKYGVKLMDATLYTTLLPCFRCSQLIVNAGIVRVVFDRDYRDHSGLDLMFNAGISVIIGENA